jgi:hypothetical protein
LQIQRLSLDWVEEGWTFFFDDPCKMHEVYIPARALQYEVAELQYQKS